MERRGWDPPMGGQVLLLLVVVAIAVVAIAAVVAVVVAVVAVVAVVVLPVAVASPLPRVATAGKGELVVVVVLTH